MPDLVVVGGGVVGAAAAWQATRRGASVVLVDARAPGRATDAGAGIVSPETEPRDASPTHLLSAAAQSFYPELIAALEADGQTETGYARCGKLVVALDDEQAGWLSAYLEMLRDPERAAAPADPTTLHEVDPAEAQAMFPPLAPVTGAFVSEDAARVDGRLLERALLASAAARGAVIEHRQVERLADLPASDAVVVAGGAWSPALVPDLDVRPQRGQILHLAVDDPGCGRWPVLTPLTGHYLLAFADRVVIGATREDGAGFEPALTAAGQHEVLTNALSVAPGLAGAPVLEWRVGLRPVAGRGYPYLGAVPSSGHDHVFVATGHGPTGLTWGPWSGAAVADLALGASSEADRAVLARFAP
ncbi:MAG: FAD-dependent oxidoreductase [Acidimicrobiia bacterium]|nr:FAD-dependent oxidoreductase [Acidimicrobiia bacterium]